ncbi:MAG: SpoIIE family protein phosphatase [Myxacorys chilensis ATA2-1-KO14]|jgi:anti-sigma regulatory factor (Ser/Thr protein kinase)/serine/threonine protein phosphatase PrpC|nr:SpoIIE family protein phosphatase [Myxacorys chilensis ATA2-1-KO14]
METCIVLPITEDSQIGEARRFVATLARALEFNDHDRGKVAIVVTEVANNLLKHAQKGQVILQSLATPEAVGIEIIALDSGPGMKDVNQCLQDGFSTGGTTGTGLGAIQRLSTFFEIYSQPQVGTVLVSRFWVQRLPHSNSPILTTLRSTPRSHPLELGAINLPKVSGDASGDAWAVENHLDRCLVLVADGLGSGALAAEASQEAVRVFQANVAQHPQAILEQIHAALRKTRGAVVAIAEILPTQQMLRYAGIGNISGVILTDRTSRSLVSFNGIVGGSVRKFAEFSYDWSIRSVGMFQSDSLLVMHSDGLASHWSLDRYPGLVNRHPALIAAVLYRDFVRSRDDVTVVVAKLRQEEHV